MRWADWPALGNLNVAPFAFRAVTCHAVEWSSRVGQLCMSVGVRSMPEYEYVA